jgi:hypothetical protein
MYGSYYASKAADTTGDGMDKLLGDSLVHLFFGDNRRHMDLLPA